jgi:glycosyltransferase involved in cell wall biosynthesis
MMPKVTIGVCVKNGALTIREAIESIIVQNYPHSLLEVIFVDDGSEDSTLSIINSFLPVMDMSVKVFHHEWKGLGASRNVVVDNAEGDYIIWVDADMLLPKDHIRKQVEFMEKNPKTGIAKAKHGLTKKNNIVATLEDVIFQVYDIKPEIVRAKLPGTGGAIYRVEAIRQIGGFDKNLTGTGEDQDVAFRVKTANWFLDQSPAVFYERRAKTWKRLWDKYLWYGYGDYGLYWKNRRIFYLYRMNPIAGFVAGALHIPNAYRLTSCKSVLFLPFHFAFKMLAWNLGFFKARLDSSHFSA